MKTPTASFSDFKLASYLLTSGNRILSTERDGSKVWFIFQETPSLHESVRSFHFDNPLVPVQDFLSAQAHLRNLIFNS